MKVHAVSASISVQASDMKEAKEKVEAHFIENMCGQMKINHIEMIKASTKEEPACSTK